MGLPDPKQSDSYAAYEDVLKNDGWTCIGGGVSGRAYEHADHPLVLKVFERCDGYTAFVDYVLKTSSPLLPTPFNLLHRTTSWGVVEMEKLAPLSDENIARLEAWWKAWCEAAPKNAALPIPQEWSDLALVLWPIAKAGDGTNTYGFDMKAANAMQRDNGDVVFIDPLN